MVDLQPVDVRETDLGDKAAVSDDMPNVHKDDGELSLPLWTRPDFGGLTDVCLQLEFQTTWRSGWQAQKQGF